MADKPAKKTTGSKPAKPAATSQKPAPAKKGK